ncbi:hypothetical protein Pmani_031940 [Petrolisthes manimaculis]|uniref:Uncharacterized protein n=1 Tax=Petrolisthes manimaculis TaxID=1843537 RepID=A0AAE1TRX0_9EUCA|nr:hypothetical protein Pmani_031940 [Petrolisthes manimaculis]
MDLNHSPVVHVTPVPSVQIGIRESDPSLVTSSLSLRYSSVDSHPQVVSQHQQPPGLCPVTYTQMSFPVSPPRPHQIIQSTQTLPSSVQREASQPVPVVLSSQPLESIHVWQAPPAQHTVQSPQMAEAVQFLQTQEAGHTQSYPQSPEQSKGTAVFLSPQFPQYQWKSQVLQPSCTAQEVLHSPKQAQQPELSLCEPEMLMPLEPCQPKLPVPQEPHQPGLTGSQEPYQTELLHPHELDQSEQFHPLESSQSELLPLLTSDQSNLTHPQEPYQSEISQLYNPQVPVVQESQRPLPQEPHLSDLSVPREKSQRRARKHKVCFTCNSHFNQSDSTLRPLFPMVETEHEGIVHYAPSSFPMNKFNSHPKALNNVCTSPYQAVTKGMAVNPTRDTCTQSVVSVLRIEGKQKPEQKKPKRKMSLQKGTSRLKNRRLDTHNTVQKYPTYSQAITDLHMQYTSIAQGGKRQETVSKEEWGAAESKTVLEKEHQIIAGRGMKMAPKEEARVKVEMRGGYTGEGKDYKRPKRAAAVVADVKSLCLVLEERESIVNMRKQIKEKRGWNMEMIKQNQSIVRGCNSNQHMVDRDCSSLPSPGYFSTDQVSYMHSTPISSSFLPDGHLHELRNLQITSEDDLCDVKTQQRALECEEQEWKSKEEELLGETDSVVWTLVEEKNGRATTTVMEEGSETMMREILRTMKECQKDKGNRKSMEKGAAVESELIMEDDIIFNVSGKGNKKEEGVKEMEIMKKQMVSLDEDLQDFEMTVGWGKEVSREQLCNLTKESSERGLCFTVQNDNNTDIMKDDSLMEEKLGKCEEQEKPISAKLDVEEGMVRLKRKADKIEESCSGGKRQEDNEMKKYEVHKSQCEIKLKIYGTGMLNQEEAKEAKIRKQKTEIDNQHEKQEIEGEENIEKIGDAKDSREELKKNQEEELLFWPDLWVSESDLVFTEEGLLKLEEDSYIAQIR